MKWFRILVFALALGLGGGVAVQETCARGICAGNICYGRIGCLGDCVCLRAAGETAGKCVRLDRAPYQRGK